MKKARLHPREKERLKLLEELRILDSAMEPSYDEITALASKLLKTPISLVSLVDSERQWFKSKTGLNASETPRDLAFCAHAILQNDVFAVPDARKDNRFHDNPLVTDSPHVIFYAGVPLKVDDHLPVGTLCVIDSSPRSLSDEDRETLRILANQVIRRIKKTASKHPD